MDITPATTVINVDRNTINSNTKHGTNEPPVRIQKGKSGKSERAHEVAVLDKNGEEAARFIYKPDGALVKCGARLVLLAHHGAKAVEPSTSNSKNSG